MRTTRAITVTTSKLKKSPDQQQLLFIFTITFCRAIILPIVNVLVMLDTPEQRANYSRVWVTLVTAM
jgi:hypothetical protein